MLCYSFIAVLLLACLFNSGDAQITAWAQPVISGTASGSPAAPTAIAEDAATSTTVLTFEATPTGSDTIASYELLTTGTPFSLSTPDGDLTVTGSLDYETTTSYVIEVKATDSAGTPNVGTATVTISVTDVNEATPAFGQTSYTVCAVDGATADTTVTTFYATDADTDNTIAYSIHSGNTNSDFKVSAAELQVNTGKSLAMTTTATYTLVVHATDDGTPAKTGSATYTVNVESACNGATALTVTFFTLSLTLVVSLN